MSKNDQVDDVSGGETPPTGTPRGKKVTGTQVAVGGGVLGALLLAVGTLAQMGFLPTQQEKMDLEKRLLRIEQKQEEIAESSTRQQGEILRAVQEVNAKLDSKMSVQAFEVWRLRLQLANPQVALTVPPP